MSERAQSGAPQSSGALEPGATVAGRYAIESVIGEGASGMVYVAERIGEEYRTQQERVALKVIHRHMLRDRQIKGRFHREAQLLGKLEGKNLVPLLDFGEDDDGLLYMALELIEGKALDELMPEGRFAPERAVSVVRQVCAALEAAHGAGIVHRDLKPGNVLLEKLPGGEERVRVLDFGMAKMLRGDATDSITALTEQNMVFGTPQYMAPEQARGDEVDARCDVYAAGIILYELLTGTPPFDGSTPIGVMTAHLVEEPTPPSSRAPSVTIPAALESVVLFALAKKPDDRYPSARALADALSAALADPSDVRSIRPLATSEDMALGDTDLDLDRPAESGEPPRATPVEAPDRTWIVVGIVAAVAGIAAGILVSLIGGG